MAYRVPKNGSLRESVRIERRTAVDDGRGGFTDGTWTTLVSATPAKIAPLKGGESVLAMRLSGVAQYDIAIRYVGDITTADRVVDVRAGTIYNIKWTGNLDEHGRYLHIACETGGLVDGS